MEQYDIIRQGLISRNKKNIKSSVQRLIAEYEEGKNLIQKCKRDLCAILYNLVQDNDANIRKWVYHLVVYVHDNNLINRCILNLTENKENDKENITWIIALASLILDDKNLRLLYKKHAENQKINESQYRICISIFSDNSIKLTKKEIRRIIDSDDFLSKMWLTKIYACHYDSQKRGDYAKYVNDNEMNALIDDKKVCRYALWAFSAQKDIDIARIRKVKPYSANNLEIKSQAWYYNCLFKDKNYVFKHRDHIIFLIDSFLKLSSTVQFGILRGLEMANYNLGYLAGKIIYLYNELDEYKFEESLILIQLTKILIKHAEEDKYIDEFLTDIKSTIKNSDIRKYLNLFHSMKGGENMPREYIIHNIGQYIENANTVIQNKNIDSENATEITKVIQNGITKISEKVNCGACDDLFSENTELNIMITKIEYELDKLKREYNGLENNTSKKISELENLLDKLKKSNNNEKKTIFSDFLTKLSQICTITVATPKIIDMLEPIINHIKIFVGL